jgi:hypothetical protein
MGIAIHFRHHIGTDGRRRQVDHGLAGGKAGLAMSSVRGSAGGVEHQFDLRPNFHFLEASHALVGRRNSKPAGALQAFGFRIDPDQCRHLQHRRGAENLDHQVGADIAGTDNGYFERAGR